MEGTGIIAPALHPYETPATLAILMGFLMIQHRGKAYVGRLFGPVIVVSLGFWQRPESLRSCVCPSSWRRSRYGAPLGTDSHGGADGALFSRGPAVFPGKYQQNITWHLVFSWLSGRPYF